MSGYKYPTRAQLNMPGYGGSGEFVLNGTLRITEGSTLGGVIQSTSDTGVLIIEEGTYLKNSTADLSVLDPAAAVDLDISLVRQTVPETDTWVVETSDSDGDAVFYNWVQQDGGKGGYADNTTWFNLPARVYNGEEMVELTPGTWKSSVASYDFTDTSHQRYCTNGASVDAVAVRNDDGSTTLTLKVMKGEAVAPEKYVFLVKYVTAGGTLVADGTGGVYTIPAEGLSASIECALLGDVNGDGSIKSGDYAKLKNYFV